MLDEWTLLLCFSSSHRAGGGRWYRGGPVEDGFPSFPDSANICQVNLAGSMMRTDTDFDMKPVVKELLSPFCVRKPRPRARATVYPNSKVKASNSSPFSLGLRTPSSALIKLGLVSAVGVGDGSVDV